MSCDCWADFGPLFWIRPDFPGGVPSSASAWTSPASYATLRAMMRNEGMPLLGRLTCATSTLCVLVLAATAADAQPLGSFTWQVQPFCNRVTVMVTQAGATYTLYGLDDQCGSQSRASVVGTAVPNANGSISIGFTAVVATGFPVHVSAQVTLPSASGTWVDSLGNAGAFVLNWSGRQPATPRYGIRGRWVGNHGEAGGQCRHVPQDCCWCDRRVRYQPERSSEAGRGDMSGRPAYDRVWVPMARCSARLSAALRETSRPSPPDPA